MALNISALSSAIRFLPWYPRSPAVAGWVSFTKLAVSGFQAPIFR